MGRRSDHSRAQIREMAVRAATTLLVHRGLEALTVRTIAKHIGYTVGTLYLVFDGLDELIDEVNERSLIELREQMRAATAGAATGQRIRALVDAYLCFAAEQSQRFRLLFEYRRGDGRVEPQHLAAVRADILALLADALGEHRPGPQAARLEAATTLWAAVHGLCMLSLTGTLASGEELSRRARALTDAWLRHGPRAIASPRRARPTPRRGASA